jgi:hypothetical protein
MSGLHAVEDAFKRWRTIRSAGAQEGILDLLQGLFAIELLAPSSGVWLVSPWISDIPILDNSGGRFQTVEPDWSLTHVRLTVLLRRMSRAGTIIHVATRPVPHNNEICRLLDGMCTQDGLPIYVHLAENLHEKGLLTDHAYLSGSMNFTRNGIGVNEEAVHCTSDPEEIARQRVVLSQRWARVDP